MRNAIIFFTFILGLSCKHIETKVEYYKDGKVKFSYQVFDGKKDGKCVEYYENGKIASLTFWKKDTLNGESNYFYPNGILKKRCFYKNGLLDSTYVEYYETGVIKISKTLTLGKTIGRFFEYYEDGKPQIIRDCIIKDNETYVNEVYKLNENGDTLINGSNFFTINYNKDTIKLGEHFNAFIYLKAPFFSNSKIFIYFEIPNDTMYRRVFSDNYKYNYDYRPVRPGNYKMKGFIDEFIMVRQNSDSIKRSRYLYFDISYYVKP